ncbi:O-antigen ligase family protein [Bacteroides uniformis]|jgi:hypothetical protein|uniref:O-antigen ligase domain-containing protein n=1 Tax=Bacteroides uniformis TaxID=820 RepID=A0A3E4QZW7_BACUN|nr:O-antigen ligase family protein [Bacteroides uniformis]RGL12760.1 O-antigen ligase domain-containing protein [Bacteroides uniformis]
MKFIPIDYSRQKGIVRFLFVFLFYFDFFITLLPMWSASPLYAFVSPEVLGRIWLLSSLGILIACGFFILINQRRIYNKLVVGSVVIVYLFYLFSITINGFKSGSIAILGIPISFFIMFDTIKQYKFGERHLNFIFYLLLAWSFTPLILCIIPSLRYSFFLTPEGGYTTFSGFAIHRNFYGILLGVLYLLLCVKKMSFLLKFLLLSILLFCMILSASRTAIISCIAITCALIYYSESIKKKTKVIFFAVTIILSSVIYWILTNPEFSMREIDEDSGREDIITGFIELIQNSPFWGYGEEVTYYSRLFPNGAIAHNFLLQTTANYGIFVTLSFVILLVIVFYYSQPFSKIILLYLIIWGLTQPYFGFGAFSPHVLIPMFVGYFLDNNMSSMQKNRF